MCTPLQDRQLCCPFLPTSMKELHYPRDRGDDTVSNTPSIHPTVLLKCQVGAYLAFHCVRNFSKTYRLVRSMVHYPP